MAYTLSEIIRESQGTADINYNLVDNKNTIEKYLYSIADSKITGSDFAKSIVNTINTCSKDLLQVSKLSSLIKAEGGWDAFWHKSDNIKTLAGNLILITEVQQKTLDMLVLLMGASSRMKNDYNVIMESIEELSKTHTGKVEVLEYLVKIKNTVNEIKRRDDLLQSLITDSKDLREEVNENEEKYKRGIQSLEEKYKDEIQAVMNSLKLIETKHSDLIKEYNQLSTSSEAQININESLYSKLSTNRNYQIVMTILFVLLSILYFVK